MRQAFTEVRHMDLKTAAQKRFESSSDSLIELSHGHQLMYSSVAATTIYKKPQNEVPTESLFLS
jgi:hypothetical protein